MSVLQEIKIDGPVQDAILRANDAQDTKIHIQPLVPLCIEAQPPHIDTEKVKLDPPQVQQVLTTTARKQEDFPRKTPSMIPSHIPPAEVDLQTSDWNYDGEGNPLTPIGPPMLIISLNDNTTYGIIDTGCEKTNITTTLLQLLGIPEWEQSIRPTKHTLTSATGHPLEVKGEIPITFTLGSQQKQMYILVVVDTDKRLLLGNDFLFNFVTIHDSKVVSIMCKQSHVREVIPIYYKKKPFSNYEH